MNEMVKVATDDVSVSAYIARPNGVAKGAIIVIHEVWGLVEHIKSVADRLAGEGYLTLAPELIDNSDFDSAEVGELQKAIFDPEKRNAVQPQLRKLMAPLQEPAFAEQTVTRLKACFDYLYAMPEARQKVAVTGFCFGGSYSFSLAVSEPKLLLALPFYGHSDQPTDELRTITCPVRAFYGQKDERLILQLPGLTDRMQTAGIDFVAKVYPECGHAFFNDSNPLAYNQAAAEDAWQRILNELQLAMR